MKGIKIQEIGDLLSDEQVAAEVDESTIEELAKVADGDDLFELAQEIINEEEEEKDYSDEE